MATIIKIRKMGTLLIIAGLVLLHLQTFAATMSHEISISPLRFAGVHALGTTQTESDAFLVLHTAAGGNWNFNLLDHKLEEIRKGNLETPRHSFFNGLTTNGEYTLLNFVVNAFTQSSTYVVLNKTGEEVARTTRNDLQMLRRGEQFLPSVYNHPDGGFIIVETRKKGNKAGYTLEHLTPTLQSVWSTTFFAKRGNAHVYDIAINTEGVFVLEATERNGQTRNVRLHGIEAATGNHNYTMELTDDNYTYFPTTLYPLDDGSIALSGTYFNGNRINSQKNQGLFFLTVMPDGQTQGMTNHPWRLLRPTLQTSVPDWFFKVMPDVWIHAIEVDQYGNFVAIAELYRYSGEVRQPQEGQKKESYHRIRLLDFMVFGFDQNGTILYTERIERPHMVIKLDSQLSGGSGSLSEAAGKGTLHRARAMKKAGALTYRFHQKNEGNFNLAFSSYEAKKHHVYLMDLNGFNSLKTDLTHAKPKAISYLEIIDLCANQSGFGFILSELNTRSFDDSEAYWRGVLPAANNAMLTYEFMPLTGKLKLNLQELID